MKRFFAVLIAAIFIFMAAGIPSAFASASVSISGTDSPKVNKSYDYTVSISAYGINFIADVSCSGAFVGSSVNCDAGSRSNVTLKSSATITVTVKSDAKPGDTGYIKVNGQGCVLDSNNNPTDGYEISKTFSYKVTDTTVSSTPKPTIKSIPKSTKTATPSPTPTAEPLPTPSPTPSATANGWELAQSSVLGMTQGGSADVTVTGSTLLPASLLTALKEKQGTLNIDFGSYTCSIDGLQLGDIPADMTELDLGLTLEKDTALSQAAGGLDTYQLHFTYHGVLPGCFVFSFKALQNKPGDTVYLYYYYDQAGVIEGTQAAVVDEAGYVRFEIYHCSSYFVSDTQIDGAAGIIAAAPEDKAGLEESVAPEATPAPSPNVLTASAASPVERFFGVSYVPLIAGMLGVAMISIFLTMLFCHVGLFRKQVPVSFDEEAPQYEPPEDPDDME